MNDAQVAGEIAGGFAAAWNKHDMTALGRLFHDDTDFVNVIGTHMRGRESIERQHGVAHAGPFRNSTLKDSVEDAREIVPGVIVTHVQTQLEGDERAPGQIRQTRMTLVIEQRAAQWRIIAGHNTGIVTPAA
jgi:uncharacterized protein (TIGR02246 family)